MTGVRAEGYIKTRACPSKEDIFGHSLPRGKSDQIVRHISGYYQRRILRRQTDFLSAYIPITEEYESAEMPVHLRRLDAALLIGG